MTRTKKNTDDMQTELTRTESLRQFLEENQENFQTKEVSTLLNEKIREKRLSKAEVAKASGMSEVYLHQLVSGRRNSTRSRLICICIGMGFTLEETQNLLQHAGMAMLYSRSRSDAIIIYGITHHMDLFTINDMLYDEDEDTLI